MNSWRHPRHRNSAALATGLYVISLLIGAKQSFPNPIHISRIKMLYQLRFRLHFPSLRLLLWLQRQKHQ